MQKRAMYVTPHLSTGGLPQYLLKKIQQTIDTYDIVVVEHSYLGTYDIQRKEIIGLVNNFVTLGEDKDADFKEALTKYDPDILNFEELSETMFSYELLEEVYTKENRKYVIVENTHSSYSDPDNKVFLPDKFIFASSYSQMRYADLNVPSDVWEYPIEIIERPQRKHALEELGLDPEKKHILNVGLFTPGKNQKELLDIAKKFGDDVIFHFVGNQAMNFESYWKPLMEELPSNCVIWGERNDTQKFMLACDVFYFCSVFELNPLVVKEALSCQIPILMRRLHTYMGKYDNVNSIKFLSSDIESNERILRNALYGNKTKIVHLCSVLDSYTEKKSISSVSALADKTHEYTIHYNPVTTEFDKDRPPMWENDSLNPGHFGCFEAFRKALQEDFPEEYDYLVICERDCLLEKNPDEIKSLLDRTYDAMETHDVHYFSFGDKVDLDNCYLQSERIAEIEDFAYETNKIIGLQFIVFDRKGKIFLDRMFKEEKWYGMDIWLNIVFEKHGMKMGILNERVTTQIDGLSLIDNSIKKFKGNEQNV